MPITPEDKKWIETNLQWLFQQFGHASFLRNELVVDPHAFFPHSLGENPAPHLQQLANRMCHAMDIPAERLQMDFFFRENHHGGTYALGTYEEEINLEDGTVQFLIMLNLSAISIKASIISTLAHEFSHVKLLGENRVSAADADHEYLTDLCMLFWGFGVIAANQAFSSRTEFHPDDAAASYTAVRKSGYLPLEMWAYALALYCRLKEIQQYEVLPYLSREMAPLFAASWQELEAGLPLAWSELMGAGTPADPMGRNLLAADVQQRFQKLDLAIQQNAFPQAWLDRARLNQRYGLYAPALRDLHQLLQTGKLRDEALLERAQVAMDLHQYEASINELEKLSPAAKKWPESLYLRSYYHWYQQEIETAEQLLDQCLAIDPQHASSHWSKGTLRFQEKKLEQAKMHFQIAIKRNPLKPYFWVHLAMVHLWEANAQAASEALHTALGLDKNNAQAYIGRGILRRKEKRYAAAMQDFDTALRLAYYYTEAEWHKRVTEQLMAEELWIAIGNFDTLEEAFPTRQQLQARGIKHRFRDQETVNLTASTNISKWLYVREDRVEEAMDLLTDGFW